MNAKNYVETVLALMATYLYKPMAPILHNITIHVCTLLCGPVNTWQWKTSGYCSGLYNSQTSTPLSTHGTSSRELEEL